MKIGIYSGTFDPIHIGHLNFAASAVEQTELDKVVIVAEKNPYRKKPFASWSDRQAMIERATEKMITADHDYRFSNKLAHQHTMQNMLQTAEAHYGGSNQYWFLVGSDIFKYFSRWESLLSREEYGGFIVALREDHSREWLQQRLQEITNSGTPLNIQLIDNKQPHISSKKIREAIANNQSVENVDESTSKYIQEHKLYSL